MSERTAILVQGLALMALAAGLAALLYPPLHQAVGIERPDRARLAQAQQLFAAALAGGPSSRLQGHAEAVGLVASTASREWRGAVLTEAAEECKGRGTYLVREGGDVLPLALTAPHRGADQHTGTLAASLFLESRAAAAAWNSAPRNPQVDCPHALDLARERYHPFTAFALAFAQKYPEGLVVQLHGFDPQRRADAAARSAGVILSNGTRAPDARLFALANCLDRALAPHKARVFPVETGELGALSNAQGQALRGVGFAGFVHLELSAELRRDLVRDEALRARFRRCVEQAAR